MTNQEKNDALKRWNTLKAEVAVMTDTDYMAAEDTKTKASRIKRLQNNYAAFCEYYFPHYLQQRDKTTGAVIKTIHNAPFHNKAAQEVKRSANLHAVFMWPRGHAKSTHFDIFIPLWLMFQPKRLINFMVVVGKSEDSAVRLLGDIQAELGYNRRLSADFGKQVAEGDWTLGEFRTSSGVKFLAIGRGQSPRGLRDRASRPDYIVIDDLDDDELVRNEQRVNDLTQWVREALFGALDVGRGRFIMVGNLIAKNSVLQNIASIQGVHLSRIDALDKNGTPSWTEKWTKEEAAEYRAFVGYRAWMKEMMNTPIIDGTIFRHDWILYRPPLRMDKYLQLVCYTDPSFKSSANDYKASVLLGTRADHSIDVIRCMVRQCSVAEMVRWLYNLYEEVSLTEHHPAAMQMYMEANFMQDLLLDDVANEGNRRGYQLPLSGDRRKKPDKIARIETVSPLWERALVYYNEEQRNTPDFTTLIDQTLSVGHGSRSHDDGPDAVEGAIYYLSRTTRQSSLKPLMSARPSSKNKW